MRSAVSGAVSEGKRGSAGDQTGQRPRLGSGAEANSRPGGTHERFELS
jgi:hypothetical protein